MSAAVKLYVVVTQYDYEGYSTPNGIFSSVEGVASTYQQLKEYDGSDGYYVRCGLGESLEVHIYELDVKL